MIIHKTYHISPSSQSQLTEVWVRRVCSDSQGPRQLKALTFSTSSFRAAPSVEVHSAERGGESEKEDLSGLGLEISRMNSIRIPFAGKPLYGWEMEIWLSVWEERKSTCFFPPRGKCAGHTLLQIITPHLNRSVLR